MHRASWFAVLGLTLLLAAPALLAGQQPPPATQPHQHGQMPQPAAQGAPGTMTMDCQQMMQHMAQHMQAGGAAAMKCPMMSGTK